MLRIVTESHAMQVIQGVEVELPETSAPYAIDIWNCPDLCILAHLKSIGFGRPLFLLYSLRAEILSDSGMWTAHYSSEPVVDALEYTSYPNLDYKKASHPKKHGIPFKKAPHRARRKSHHPAKGRNGRIAAIFNISVKNTHTVGRLRIHEYEGAGRLGNISQSSIGNDGCGENAETPAVSSPTQEENVDTWMQDIIDRSTALEKKRRRARRR